MKAIELTNKNILIDKNLDEPIIIIHDLKEQNHSKELSITLEKGIKASIIEIFIEGKDSETYSFKREFIAKENSNLTYAKYQDVQSLSSLEFDYLFDLKESSILQVTNFELGNAQNSNRYKTYLKEKDINVEIAGLVKLDEKTQSNSSFDIEHIEESCKSNIKYRHILDGNSKAVFQAKSIVEQSANFSQVHQSTDTILLSDDAVVFNQPHLEINIDELEASHGATTGSLDEEQLLYLQSRGLNKELASKLLLKAFENEIYDNIHDKNLNNIIEEFTRG